MPTILLIDDSPAQRASLHCAIEASGLFGEILEAADGVAGAKLLLSRAIDLVICDVEMPGLDGDKLVHLTQGRNISFLMLTGVRDPKRRAALFRLGARDVITKPVDPLELIARVELHLELSRLQRELVEKNELLERLSTTDSLTGLHNRRFLERALELEWLRSRRGESPLCLLMADIDHFKQINDRHGHAAGDEVLREVAARLTRGMRATDVAGRYGGEEFLMVLASPLPGARIAAERWRKDIESEPIQIAPGVEVSVTLSVGLAARLPSTPSSIALLAAADAALYAAKLAGRNRVSIDPAARSRG